MNLSSQLPKRLVPSRIELETRLVMQIGAKKKDIKKVNEK